MAARELAKAWVAAEAEVEVLVKVRVAVVCALNVGTGNLIREALSVSILYVQNAMFRWFDKDKRYQVFI